MSDKDLKGEQKDTEITADVINLLKELEELASCEVMCEPFTAKNPPLIIPCGHTLSATALTGAVCPICQEAIAGRKPKNFTLIKVIEKLVALNTAIKKLEEKIKTHFVLQSRLDSLQAQVTLFNAQLTTQTTELAVANGKLTNAEKECKKVRQEKAQREREVNDLQHAIKTLQSTVKNLQKQLLAAQEAAPACQLLPSEKITSPAAAKHPQAVPAEEIPISARQRIKAKNRAEHGRNKYTWFIAALTGLAGWIGGRLTSNVQRIPAVNLSATQSSNLLNTTNFGSFPSTFSASFTNDMQPVKTDATVSLGEPIDPIQYGQFLNGLQTAVQSSKTPVMQGSKQLNSDKFEPVPAQEDDILQFMDAETRDPIIKTVRSILKAGPLERYAQHVESFAYFIDRGYTTVDSTDFYYQPGRTQHEHAEALRQYANTVRSWRQPVTISQADNLQQHGMFAVADKERPVSEAEDTMNIAMKSGK
jgi:hypothetical protein